MYYNEHQLVTSISYEVLMSRVPDILYWKAIEKYTHQEFLHNAVTIMDPQSDYDQIMIDHNLTD